MKAPILELNRELVGHLGGPHRLEVVPGGDHLFGEPGALRLATTLMVDWFVQHLGSRRL